MTTPLLADLVATVVGLVVLTVGADLLVRGASALATRFGVPPLVVGLTVVAFGTSAPELAVSVDASLAGRTDVALGNVIGSNIFNVLAVLGASALIAPLVVKSQLVRLDVPVMTGIAILPLVLGLDGALTRGDGAILLLLLGAYLVALLRLAARGRAVDVPALPAERSAGASLARNLLLVGGGLALLIGGARALVVGATGLARGAGVSELVVGLTVVAVGTSLPELATSVVSSLRGERDIAVGNVVGSNIFNVLGVLGASAFLSSGLTVSPALLRFDLPVMLGVSVICLPVFMTGAAITRTEGGVLLVYYLLYTAYLGLHAAAHPLQDEFGVVVLAGVLPLTLLAATILWVRAARRRTAALPRPSP